MIKSQQEYVDVQMIVEKFPKWLEQYKQRLDVQELHPLQKQLHIDCAISNNEMHLENIRDYEKYVIRKEKLEVDSIYDLHKMLIYGRMATGLSVAEFAKKHMWDERDLIKAELNDYDKTPFDRVKQMVNTLGISIKATI